MKTHQIAFLGIALLMGLAGCSHNSADESDSNPPLEAVAVQTTVAIIHPMASIVHAHGRLEPAPGADAKIASPLAGRLRAVFVREGDSVQAGEVVAIVDERPQQAQSLSAAAALRAAQAQAQQADLALKAAEAEQANAVQLAQLALKSAKLDRDNAVQQAKIDLETAQTELKKLLAGARPQEIAQADQAVVQAKATRDRDAAELERVRFLYEHGIDSKRDLDDAQTALQVAEANLASAQQQDSLIRAGARPEDIQAARLRVQQAQQALQRAQADGDAKVQEAKTALRQAQQGALQVLAKKQEALAMQRTVEQKQADLLAAEATADYAVLRAPLSGVVTARNLNPGDMADPNTPVLEITDPNRLILVAQLPAEDGARVRKGMEAEVFSDVLPGKPLAGRVLSVGQVNPQTNLQEVQIAVANPKGLLRVGGFASADIILAVTPHAVVIPKQAVLTQENKSLVFVVGNDGEAHQRDVRLGPEQGNLVEVLQGVAPGEQVILLGQYELSDGQKVKVVSQGQNETGGNNS